MPTRLVVLLQSRESAAAGAGAKAPATRTQPAAKPAPNRRDRGECRRGAAMVRRWFIASVPPPGGYRVNGHRLSTRMARKSLILVWVGPGVRRSPSLLK